MGLFPFTGFMNGFKMRTCHWSRNMWQVIKKFKKMQCHSFVNNLKTKSRILLDILFFCFNSIDSWISFLGQKWIFLRVFEC